MRRNILLTIAYDGSRFCGWQRQPAVRTVQGELERALTQLCGTEIRLNGVSRTDAGVHALGQCASFSGEFGIPTARIPEAVNHLLAAGGTYRGKSGDVCVLSAREMPPAFHARFDACGKRYRYILSWDCGPCGSSVAAEDGAEGTGSCAPEKAAGARTETAPLRRLFFRDYLYQISAAPDVDRMREAAQHLVGTHDFAAFQAAGGTPRETTVRTLHSLTVQAHGPGELWIEAAGDGFLYHMVRILVGTLVEVGLGKKDPADLPAILASGDRARAGHTAPAEGLYLIEVYYPNS